MEYAGIFALSFVAFVLELVALFVLFDLKVRLKGAVSTGISYLIISFFLLILIRFLDVLDSAHIFSLNFPFVHEILVVALSIFLLFGVIKMRKGIIFVQKMRVGKPFAG